MTPFIGISSSAGSYSQRRPALSAPALGGTPSPFVLQCVRTMQTLGFPVTVEAAPTGFNEGKPDVASPSHRQARNDSITVRVDLLGD